MFMFMKIDMVLLRESAYASPFSFLTSGNGEAYADDPQHLPPLTSLLR
jgi:hypothetical protein